MCRSLDVTLLHKDYAFQALFFHELAFILHVRWAYVIRIANESEV